MKHKVNSHSNLVELHCNLNIDTRKENVSLSLKHVLPIAIKNNEINGILNRARRDILSIPRLWKELPIGYFRNYTFTFFYEPKTKENKYKNNHGNIIEEVELNNVLRILAQ